MTRFARAKGSKASNEKMPEEATSWSEMKEAMLTKPDKTPTKTVNKTEVKSEESKPTTWASLEGSGSLLKPEVEEKVIQNKNKKNEYKNEGGIKNKEKENNLEESNKKKRKITENTSNGDAPPVKLEKVIKMDNEDEMNKSGPEENNGKKFVKKIKGEKELKKKVIDVVIMNGKEVPIVTFQGFPVTQDEAKRLRKLRAQLIKEGVPRNKLRDALKHERRKAEKALQKMKKTVCFHCREGGHLLAYCPMLQDSMKTARGICYKCGSTEHSSYSCKVVKEAKFQFAECFICKEQGHISKQCPDNPRGLYPQGGACRECGDVTHLRKDCPKLLKIKTEEAVTVGIRNDRNLECLDEEIAIKEKPEEIPEKKVVEVKF